MPVEDQCFTPAFHNFTIWISSQFGDVHHKWRAPLSSKYVCPAMYKS